MILERLHATYLFVKNVKETSSWYSRVLDTQLEIDDVEPFVWTY